MLCMGHSVARGPWAQASSALMSHSTITLGTARVHCALALRLVLSMNTNANTIPHDAPCGVQQLPCVFLPPWPAGFAAAESSAVAEAIKDAFCCKCATGPATAQALADSIAVAGGCGKIGEALAREWRGDSMLLWFWCITPSHGRLLAFVPRRPIYAPGGRCSLRA